MSIDQQFVEFVVKSLVGNPEAVSIERTIDEKGVLLQLTVDPEDLGRVIGKRGATAQSIRTLLRALGTKNEARYNLKIVDNGEPRERREERKEERERREEKAPVDGKPAEDAPAEPAEVVEEAPVEEAPVEETPEEPVEEEESLADRHRKDLDDLDDLDI